MLFFYPSTITPTGGKFVAPTSCREPRGDDVVYSLCDPVVDLCVKTFDQVLIGNDVIMYGYPTSLGLANILQLNPDRPLLRKGIVAGKNLQQHTLILDCPIYQGNSGGPIFEIDRDFA
jgi:hypothetical protein